MTRLHATCIREYLQHGVGTRKVRLKRDGEVHYYGHPDPFNRQHDYWHYGGTAQELLKEATSGQPQL